jgi:hypothetical protein
MSELKGQRHRGQVVAVEGTAANNAVSKAGFLKFGLWGVLMEP